ncbi:MAG TPA: nuclear transport factor 2 family protein [Opitutus sp.]|nr:nuclear transport factor 2 family protein [Opitutus sp.]
MSTATILSPAEVAHHLVALCRQGRWDEAVEKHYAESIVSVEPAGDDRESRGLAAVKAKGEWWVSNHEVHDCQVEGPFVGGDKFVVRFILDVTFKPTGQRKALDELGIYTVADGKVVHEQFYYNPQ